MPSYLDTSALLRVVESRGDRTLVDRALVDAPLTSTLAELESWAALHRQCHEGRMSEAVRDQRLIKLSALLRLVDLLPVDDSVFAEAREITRLHPLRTLDAIHLATAAVVAQALERRGQEVRFCTADRRQAQAAERRLGAQRVDFVPPP